MLFSIFDSGLAFIDIILIFVITLLDFLFYYYKKRDNNIDILRIVIPVLIIGLVIFLTIKQVVQDYFFIISIGIISIFYIYIVQSEYKEIKKKSKKAYYKKPEVEDDFGFNHSFGKNEKSDSMDFSNEKTGKKSGSEEFEALIGEIYEKQKERED
ncbi:MAG: hypothetical protein KJI71_00545 [Patescibacteria group bacterium]|nr:hypothetical protein [Patescibacteria group bacterium]